ncbi:hypothetical protein bcere0007_54860 [Bacillus mycoides]|nr:hypothetical protein bcere0007_54860 [Bacillus mycoides]
MGIRFSPVFILGFLESHIYEDDKMSFTKLRKKKTNKNQLYHVPYMIYLVFITFN